jgi:hypothetical protein
VIDDIAYRRLIGTLQWMVVDGYITPEGKRKLEAILADEREKQEEKQ